MILLLFVLNFLFANSLFTVLPLGPGGGEFQSNLTCFLLKCPTGSQYVSLDAGSLLSALAYTEQIGKLQEHLDDGASTSDLRAVFYFLQEQIVGYFLTHPHLDHTAGLIIASPDDKWGAEKPIYGSKQVLHDIEANEFNGIAWPKMPDFGYYAYTPLDEQMQDTTCGFQARIFNTSHTVITQAFLLHHPTSDRYILFFGDTEADGISGNDNLKVIWDAVAPLIVAKKLLSIFLECAYHDPRTTFYGHLSPYWYHKEQLALAQSVAAICDGCTVQNALEGLTFVVTHIKPATKKHVDIGNLVRSQLLNTSNTEYGDLGVRYIFPERGWSLEIDEFDQGITNTFTGANPVSMCPDSDDSGSDTVVYVLICFTIILGIAVIMLLLQQTRLNKKIKQNGNSQNHVPLSPHGRE